jgi:serine/threonine protein kinase
MNIPSVIGRYEIRGVLGEGGMATVYEGWDPVLHRTLAIKLVDQSALDPESKPEVLRRFKREAQAAARLAHANVVQVYEYGEEVDYCFIAMEYVAGKPLTAYLGEGLKSELQRVRDIIGQLLEALAYSHTQGVVHRDIKPGNLLLDRFGTIKILDLGLAHFFGDDVGKSAHRREIAHVIGTADYVAPEQAIDSAKVDIRGDIYSLGVTFFFLLTGRSPYKDGSLSQKLIWHQISSPTPVAELRPDVPRKLAALLERMMAKDPNQRFQTPAELMDALSPWDEGASIPPDREMPQLCPAAAVGSSMSRLPRVTPPILPAPAKRSSLWSWLLRNPRARATLLFGIMAIAAVGGAAAAVLAAP